MNLGYVAVLTSYAGEQANLFDTKSQYERLIPQMDSLREIALNDQEWEKVEGPKGAYMSKLRQTDISNVTCYGCGKKGHFKNKCPNKQKKGKDEKITESEPKKKEMEELKSW